jgi:hypothetical protein
MTGGENNIANSVLVGERAAGGSGGQAHHGRALQEHQQTLYQWFRSYTGLVQCRGSGIRDRFLPDPKPYFLYLLKNKIIYNFIIFVATKNGKVKTNFFPLLFWCFCWIRQDG